MSVAQSAGHSSSRQRSNDRVFGSGFYGDLFNRGSYLSKQNNNLAGFDPFQVLGQQSAGDFANNIGGFINSNLQGQSFLAGGGALSPDSNPYLQQTAQAAINPIFGNLTQNVLPSIRGEAAGTGNVGSSRQGIAEGLATQGALSTAGNVSSNIYSNAYGQGLQAQLGALGLGNQIAQLGLLPSSIYSSIGAERQGQQQSELDNPYNNLLKLSELLGDPSILTDSSGDSKAWNQSGSYSQGPSGGS